MHTLRRPTRPTDRRMGLVYGEAPRPTHYTEGPHAGHTVVQVHGAQALAQLLADGWQAIEHVLHVPRVTPPATLAEAVVRGTQAEVEALLEGAAPEVVAQALAYAQRVGASPALVEALHMGLAQHAAQALAQHAPQQHLPADPQSPLDAGVGPGEGPQGKGTARKRIPA